MSTQLSLSKSFDCQLAALEVRVKSHRPYHGLLLWTPIFRRILERLRKRDRSVQQELMLLEHEIHKGDREGAFARLERVKLMLSCVLLALTVTALFRICPIVRSRARGNGSVRVVRISRVRGRRNEEGLFLA